MPGGGEGFVQGASLGAQLVQQGFDEYWKGKAWRDKLKQQHSDEDWKKSEVSRQELEDYRSQQNADREAGLKKSEVDSMNSYRAAEAKRNASMGNLEQAQADWYNAGRPGGGGRGGTGTPHNLTQNQAAAAGARLRAIYDKKDAPAMPASDRAMLDYYDHVANPAAKPAAQAPPPPSWLQKMQNYFSGSSAGASTASGSSLPGLGD